VTTATKIDVDGVARQAADAPRRNYVGTVSLLVALCGAIACHVALRQGIEGTVEWLQIARAGFEAALVGALADWFAVTALFRHPLGLPIPHTAIIRARRAKIIEGIASMVQNEWLSPEVIGARLQRLAPSTLLTEWLSNREHVERLGGPVRNVLRSLARTLTHTEAVEFLDSTIQRELRDLPINASAGRWLARVAASDSAAAAFETIARSLVNLAQRPGTPETLQEWLDRSARQLHKDGKRLIPLILRRKIVQRKLVEAACDYASAELVEAAANREHPLRQFVFGAVQRLADRLAAGDAHTLEQAEQLRHALIESLEARPLVLDLLTQLRARLEQDLDDPHSRLSDLVDRQLQQGILDLLNDADRSAAFDNWVRTTANDLLRRNQHQIGLTVRENLEALDADTLVAQIEDRVGADLQFIRLNGALVGGLIGVLLHLAHRVIG